VIRFWLIFDRLTKMSFQSATADFASVAVNSIRREIFARLTIDLFLYDMGVEIGFSSSIVLWMKIFTVSLTSPQTPLRVGEGL
jgi:hypothetical protein